MRCPLDPGGTHRPTMVGYDPARCGVAHRCDCGHITIFPTDELAWAMAKQES